MANSAPRLISGICMQIASGFLAKMFNEERTEDKKEKKKKTEKKPAWPNIFRLTKPYKIETGQTKNRQMQMNSKVE